MKNKYFLNLLKIFISISIFAFACFLLDLENILNLLKKIDFSDVLSALLFVLLSIFAMTIRWYYFLKATGKHFNFLYILKTSLMGVFFNSFIPGNLGNDIYRFTIATKIIENKSQVLALLIKERIIGLIMLLCVYVVGFAFFATYNKAPEIFLLILLACCFGVIVGMSFPYWGKYILGLTKRFLSEQLTNSINVILSEQSILKKQYSTQIILLSIITHAMFVLSIYTVCHSMKIDAPIAVIAMTVTIVELARFVPITMQGIGIREAAFAWTFSLLGFQADEGFALGAVAYAILALGQLLVGGISIIIPVKSHNN